MDKFIKKICVAGLISVMTGSMMACGTKTENKVAEATKTSDGKIQIEYWYGLGGKLDENMQKIVRDFNSSQDKYEVKPIAQDDYDTTYKNLQAAISAFPIYGTTQLLYYNTKAFKDAGISEDSLKTWSGLADAASKLVKKDGGEVSFYGWEPMKGPDNLVDAALSNGGQVLSDDKTKVIINSD